MTKQEILEKVAKCFEAGGMNAMTANSVVPSKSQTLARMGIDMDADAICHVFKTGDDIAVFFVVGRSLLFGSEAYRWILEYHSHNTTAAQRTVNEIVEYAAAELPTAGECTMPFKNSKNKAWRAFRMPAGSSLKTVDEIMKRAKLRLL